MLLPLFAPVSPQTYLAEAKVTVGDKRAHAQSLGESQRITVVNFAAGGIELIGVGGDIAQQMLRMGREPGLGRTEFERSFAETPRLVAPAEQQAGTSQRVIEPGEGREDSIRRQTIQQRLAFREPVQCLAHLAELRQRPCGGGNPPGKMNGEVAGPGQRDPALRPRMSLGPLAPAELQCARSVHCHADGKVCCV